MLPETLIDKLLRRTRKKGKRRYIAPALGVAGFFSALNEAGISYCVLRWFDTLPALAPGEDIDLLIADEDLARIDAFLTGDRRSGIPCDLYTASGLPGTEYRGVSYFPPALAQQILASTELRPNNVRAPDARHHLLTMAYHAIFHKGYLSGLPEQAGKAPKHTTPEHDYVTVLQDCARRAGVPLPDVTMTSLRELLARNDWMPPVDTLEKLAQKNHWIRDTFFASHEADPAWDGLVVFIVRERGLPHLPLIRDIVVREGFHLLHEETIAPEHRASVALQVRGGNWNRGPWPASGGGPAHALVMLDLFPRPPSEASRTRHFSLANERILKAKLRVRDVANELFPPEERCNVMHSSDNPRQALHYFQLLQSQAMDEERLLHSIHELRARVASPWPVQRLLSSHGRRAIVRTVQFEGEVAVCKTFRPGCERYQERELLARQVAGDLPEVLPIVAHQGLHLVFPFFPAESGGQRFFTPAELAAVRRVIRRFRTAGYELIDFKPGNVLRHPEQGLRCIDFEFMQYVAPRGDLEGCYCWYEVPRDSGLDRPLGKSSTVSNYDRFWLRHTGLPRWMALRELPAWLVVLAQVVARGCFAGKDGALGVRSQLQQWRRSERLRRIARRLLGVA